MYAAMLRQIGGTLEYGELPDPTAGDDEVLVDVTHASVNPLDIWVSRGAPGAAADHLPWIPGTEGAGVLDGTPVLIRGAGLGLLRPGTFATKIAAPRNALVELPAGSDPGVAAALGVAGLTAYNCVNTLGAARAEDRVLVASGARVWGQTTNAEKVDGVLALGAERVIVAEADELAAAVAELAPTLVIDGLGGRFTPAAVAALQLRGRLVLFGASAGDDIPLSSRGFYRKGLTLFGYTGLIESPASQAKILAELLTEAAAGKLVVPVELVPLAQAQSAFERILERRVTGKLVLDTSS